MDYDFLTIYFYMLEIKYSFIWIIVEKWNIKADFDYDMADSRRHTYYKVRL